MAPPRRPCHFFQLGNCKGGADCDYVHVVDPNFKPKTCQHFLKGHCYRGTKCTYSHDTNETAVGTAPGSTSGIHATTDSTLDTSATRLKEFRWKVPQQPVGARPLGHALGRYFQQALELVDGELGTMQEVVMLLTSPGGLLRIDELLEQPFDTFNRVHFNRVLNGQLLPFFKIVTHSSVSSSILLRGKLLSVYNIIYASDGTGERILSLFTTLATHLLNPLGSLSNTPDDDVLRLEAVEASVTLFSRLVEVNTPAHTNPAVVLVANAFAVLIESLPERTVFATTRARKELERVRQRISTGEAIPDARGGKKAVGARAVFVVPREMPGELSDEGRRHDNDCADIKDITILPSLDEIESSRNEYLPTADPLSWHFSGIRGLLDRHFRLLREDTVGQLRDAAKWELERLQNVDVAGSRETPKRQGARTYVYKDVHVVAADFDEFNGAQVALRLAPPLALHDLSKKARMEWWDHSRRLGPDALVCLLSSEGSAKFLVIASQSHKPTRLQSRYDLGSDPEHAFVVARLVNPSELHDLLPRAAQAATHAQLSIVEFPGVLLPSFQPTLEAIQRVSEGLDIPFHHILAPTSTSDDSERGILVKPPAYASQPGFQYDLASITTNNEALYCSPEKSIQDSAAQLARMSTLDHGQAEAVVSALAREIALIQGPPGTGKSYSGVQLVRVILANKPATKIGPVLICTQTNHALDAILERSVDDHVENIVRIGSRSKSERLEDVNLKVLAQKMEPTKTERSSRYDLTKKVKQETKEINGLLDAFGSIGSQNSLAKHLFDNHPELHKHIFEYTDDDGYTRVTRRQAAPIDDWLRAGRPGPWRPRPVADLSYLPPPELTFAERRLLLTSWMSEIEDELHEKLRHAMSAYNESKKALDNIRTELQLRVLSKANIIGVTTSGLARNLELLRSVDPKVLLCEEAGEILEAHLLTALLPSVEHCILIGDHQQLRPHAQKYELSTESRGGSQYALDVSLFERLVKPSDDLSQPLPLSALEVQRRMHPSISRLVRETQYQHLQDDSSVSLYPEVAGMRRRLSWLHHENFEDDNVASHSTSRTNTYEVNVVASLVRHLAQQGVYGSADIAVITPYVGQLRKLRQKFSNSHAIILNERDAEELAKEDSDENQPGHPSAEVNISNASSGSLNKALRLATVDNFQGEEAKVVVVSLVRSNKDKTPGFLKTPNRINVLLSRAQHGMYIVGNTHTAETVPMWREVIEILRSEGNVSESLELCCPRHPDTPMSVKSPSDFARLSPEAGCSRPCEKQLACGHACVAACHSDMLHSAVYCLKPCTRLRAGCEHVCPKPCGEKCGPHCEIPINNLDVVLECGHRKTSLPCYQHQNPLLVKCEQMVRQKMPGCDHEIDLPCHVDASKAQCFAPCGQLLKCGHTCGKSCSQCSTREGGSIQATDHGKCVRKCNRGHGTCKHSCQSECHDGLPCPLCTEECDTSCAHARCGKLCKEPCAPCLEVQCTSGIHCPHSTPCPMPCAAPCTWIPCSERCELTLSCGCRCPSVCGEACPDAIFCQKHATDDIKTMQADLVMLTAYEDVDLDTDPCIFTACGHVFTIDTLDGTMGMQQFYEIDPVTNRFIALKTSAEPFSFTDSKSCPECRGSLRNLARYGRLVRRALLDSSAKKLTAWSNTKHHELTIQLLGYESKLMDTLDMIGKPGQDVKLEGTPEALVKAIRKLSSERRYRDLLRLTKEVFHFKQKLSADEQPYQRVHDLVETVRRQTDVPHSVVPFTFSSEELQLREHLQAGNLLLRCYLTVFGDVLSFHTRTPAVRRGGLYVNFTEMRHSANDLIEEAAGSKNVRQEAELRVIWARFAAMEYGVATSSYQVDDAEVQGRMDLLMRSGLEHLDAAQAICKQQAHSTRAYRERIARDHPDRLDTIEGNPLQGLADELAEIRRMFRENLSTTEMRMVVTAMAKEFRGTGHWYRCVHGHPFSVGECGMPMQLARCPECGAEVGGQNHQSVGGVSQARDIEQEFGELSI